MAKLNVFDYNSENKTLDEELDEEISNIYKKENRIRDSFKNVSKVYVGLINNKNLFDIKETNIVLIKNKSTFNGMDATEVRIKEYERLLDIAKTKYGASSIVLMEKHWVRTLIPSQKSIIDLDGIKRNALHQIIDYKTHLKLDSPLMYSQNGNVIIVDLQNNVQIYKSREAYYNEYGD